jgi:Putative peptidoglycan binding domain
MNKLLRRGCQGADVRLLQQALNARPYIRHIDEDGVFGPKTEEAVRAFQHKVHISEDGIVGPVTYALLWTRVAAAQGNVTLPTPQNNPVVPAGQKPVPPVQKTPDVIPARSNTTTPESEKHVVYQVQAGAQANFAPWYMRPKPLPGDTASTIYSGFVGFAIVYRTASDGPHIEASLNPQILLNSKSQASDPRYSLQLNGQIMFADLYAPGRWHLISPYLQGSLTNNRDPGSSGSAGVSAGNQVSFDIVPDKLQVNVQGAVGGVWDLSKHTFSVSPAVTLGITVGL